MSKYTEGPWDYQTWPPEPFRTIGAKDTIVARTVGGNDEANARLIAASPDLLVACKLVLDLNYGKSTHLTAEHVNKQITAAIAKAEK